jgi:serine O-acetyltransferase
MTAPPPSDTSAATEPTEPGLRELIWSDYAILGEVGAVLREMGEPTSREGESPSRLKAPRRFLTSASLRAALLFRLNAGASRRTSWFWQSVLLALHSCEVMRGATIGPSLRLPHPYGIGIGNRVVIGRNVTLAHNVTLGADRAWSGQPHIGDEVTVHPGAVIAGPITIGEGAVIGANSVVLEDVEPGGLAAPARTRIANRRVNRRQGADRPMSG